LVRLVRAGLPVPAGFIIRVPTCDAFLKGNRWPDGLKEELVRELNRLSATTFAVRSSAAVSMPGMLETKLDVPAAEVPAAVEAVFNSWNADRAVGYRTAHHLRLPGTAVVVQEMVSCDRAGVAFSRDPLGGPGCRVEVVRGSGQALVAGEDVPEKDCLTAEQIEELLTLVRRVEDLFAVPVDVEWGLSQGRFVLLQARPIRSLQLRQRAKQLEAAEARRLVDFARGRRTVWVAHNLGETVIHPTPLEWDFWSRFMSGSGGVGKLFRQIGYRPPAGGFLELVLGRVYADALKEAEFSGFGVPLTIDADAIAKDPATPAPVVDRSRTGFRDVLKLPLVLWRMYRVTRNTAEPPDRTVARFHDALPPFEAWVDRERTRPLTSLSVEVLLDVIDARRRRVFDEFGPESIRPGFFCGLLLHTVKDPSHPGVRTLLETRELARTAFRSGLDLIWAAVDELDIRWSAGGGLRFLTLDELPTYPSDRTRFDATIAERRLNRDAARLVHLPPVIDSAKLEGLTLEPSDPAPAPTANALSPGAATGPVWLRVEDSPPPGAVVVAETAHPELAKWLPAIAAIVVERGGVLSHLAVLAREAGIPAVVCPDATRQFRAGEVLQVDGTAGRVEPVTPRTPA
jgi:phosphohistidine swiveling domain-containing protein